MKTKLYLAWILVRFCVALLLGSIAAFFHLLAWPFYTAAIALSRQGLSDVNTLSETTPEASPPLRDVPAVIPPQE